jgi:uncharacterized protein (TIGR03437 family)
VKRIIGSVFAQVIFCLITCLSPISAQTPTPTPTPQRDELSAFQRTDTVDRDLILRAVSDDGRRFVFESTGNLTGGNGDGNQEIFLYDVDLRGLIQVTNTADVLNDPADASKGIKTRVTSNVPVISGDGRYIVFSSNSELIVGPNTDGNQEIFLAFIPRLSTTITNQRITDTNGQNEVFENYTPTINRDGSVIAFVSVHNITASNSGATVNNADRNAEIFIYNRLSNSFFQVTSKLDSEASPDGVQVRGFNAAPYLSGDGRVLAFVSGFNFTPDSAPSGTPNNRDFNGEIFVYKTSDPANTVTQVTSTTTADALAGLTTVNLLTLSARHLNNDGSLLVFESSGNHANNNTDKTREVFLYKTTEADRTKAFLQLTDQKLPATPTQDDLNKLDQNFLPSINSAGTFVTFGSVRLLTELTSLTVEGTPSNADGSREVLRLDLTDLTKPTIRQITFTQPSARFLDQRENTPVSWINDAGDLITFHTASDVTGRNSDRTFEIFQTLVRPVTNVNADAATLVNAASFAPAPSSDALPTIARGATGAIFGTRLANTTAVTPSIDLPFDLAGVSVTVAGVAAQLIFVSPGQVNIQFPSGIAAADSVEFTVNNNGVLSKGKVKVADVGPAIYTVTSGGSGGAAAQCLAIVKVGDTDTAVFSTPPCEVSTAADVTDRYLIIYGTGWRNGATGAVTVQVQKDTADPVTLTTNYVGAQPGFALTGLDQINAILPNNLAKGTLKLFVNGPNNTKSQDGVTIELR